MGYPPERCIGVRRRKPAPDPANADATGTLAKPPRKPRRRKFRFSRREDLLYRLRMGKPIFRVLSRRGFARPFGCRIVV
jgi:hypothetical protein